jgi:hypothetical protein
MNTLFEHIQYSIKSKHEYEKSSNDGTVEKSFSVRNNDKEYRIKLEKDNSEYCLTLLKYEPKDKAWTIVKKIVYGDKETAERKFDKYKEVFGKKVVQSTIQNKVVVQELDIGKSLQSAQDQIISAVKATPTTISKSYEVIKHGFENWWSGKARTLLDGYTKDAEKYKNLKLNPKFQSVESQKILTQEESHFRNLANEMKRNLNIWNATAIGAAILGTGAIIMLFRHLWKKRKMQLQAKGFQENQIDQQEETFRNQFVTSLESSKSQANKFGKKSTTLINRLNEAKQKLSKENVNESLVVQELWGTDDIPVVSNIIDMTVGSVDAVISNIAKSIKGSKEIIANAPANSPVVQQAQNVIADKSNLMKFLEANKTNAIAAGAIVGGGLLTAGAVKLYKNFFSADAKLCANSPNKAECMKELKINAIKKSISALSKAKGQYGTLPERYRNQAISRLDKQIGVMKNKINIIAVNK